MILTLGTTPTLQRTMTFARLAIDSVNRATSVYEHASGKSVNVARVVHALGENVFATGFMGGRRGMTCTDDLDKIGVRHDFVQVESETRLCTTLLDQSTGDATELVENAGPVTADNVETLLDQTSVLVREAKLLVLSGTLAPGCGDDFYARCMALAKAAHVPAIVDAKGAPLKRALVEKPFLVKPNRGELSATVDRPIETDEQLRDVMRELVAMGTEWVVVTNGPGETILTDGKSFWRISRPKIQAVNPIGSGDSFAAGIAVGVMRGQDVPEACALGAACGAANAMTEFAGQVRREDVERLKHQIVPQRLP